MLFKLCPPAIAFVVAEGGRVRTCPSAICWHYIQNGKASRMMLRTSRRRSVQLIAVVLPVKRL